MITFLFIRHGYCDCIGKYLAGRTNGVHLNDSGVAQAEALARTLADVPVSEIYSSPLERTVETASFIAAPGNLKVCVREELSEVDYGAWTGKTFTELEKFPLWRRFNDSRGSVRIPGGEMMVEVASRMSLFVERVRRHHKEGVIAVVSHGDPIRAVIAHYAGIPLDNIVRFDIDPASVSPVNADDHGFRILGINHTTG